MKKQIIFLFLLTISLSSIGQISCSTEVTDEHCGYADGIITVNLSDTCPTGFTYLWNNINSDTTATITGLPAGCYTVTVTCGTDTCITSACVTNLPGPSVVILSVTNSSCNQANGGATVTAIYAVAPITFAWSNGQTGPNLVNVSAGTYTVTVTDAYCYGWAPIVIIDSVSPTCAITNIIDVSEPGNSDGFLFVTPTGGTPPYTYLWSTNPPQTDSVASNIVAGSYMVTVCDANNCCCTSVGTVQEGSAINEISKIKVVSISPNPASTNLTIEYNQPALLTIYNLQGQQLMQREMKAEKTEINISGFARGMYFVKMESSEGAAVRKIVKE